MDNNTEIICLESRGHYPEVYVRVSKEELARIEKYVKENGNDNIGCNDDEFGEWITEILDNDDKPERIVNIPTFNFYQ